MKAGDGGGPLMVLGPLPGVLLAFCITAYMKEALSEMLGEQEVVGGVR